MFIIISVIVVQIVIFFALTVFFRKLMSQNVTQATRHLDEMSDDYNRKEKELNRREEEAKLKSEELLRKAQEEAGTLKAEAMKQAETERDDIITTARASADEIIQQAEKSRKQLITEVENRISKEAMNKACELLEGTLPDEFKQVVHSRWVDELIEHGFGKVEKLHIAEDIDHIRIVSAFTLTDEQRKKITKRIKDILGRELRLDEETNPKLVAGVSIDIGSLVLDGSLKNKIREKAR